MTLPQLGSASALYLHLTIQESDLYREILCGNWEKESEKEKYHEIRTLVRNRNIDTCFAALGASNAFQLGGYFPQDKDDLLHTLDRIISETRD